ncbi:transmembrane protein, putative (macronuclear) [Tetrahymena thermophila SB210]|uniref:Transmembrane protein, putative n=1 Tax=Tetrahymena thermophila (strain SB210) TaxID=312017 RepID=I7MDD2_TETTS|nr:transmembrane protein, putative [Tetrahymena thermophila SB210]EAR87363.2 transmembrane protein, putative [Tetrahymena thermophila SB210]|eukprot:XP_001007608.2 transmembrane protein, putative [Tetrahymena thermophila SB210]
MNAQKTQNNTQVGVQGNGIGGGEIGTKLDAKKKDKQMNKFILKFKEQQLEDDFNNSQAKQLSRYSYITFIIAVIPLLFTFFLLPFYQRKGGMPAKIYVYYIIPIVVFISNIVVQKKYPNLFDYTHSTIVLILHLLICWQMVDTDITTFNSFSEFYKGFIFANVYIFLYISAKYTTKIILILVVNISAIFIFPHHSNIWILIIAQSFLMLMLLVKFYNEDLMKRHLFMQTRKQNLWDSIIEEFLPINLIVVKYNKTTQRLELTQTNKCASRKLRIINDDDLQHFLDRTIIETNENTTTSFMNNNNNILSPTNNNILMEGKNGSKTGNPPFQRQATQLPKGGQIDLSKSLNLGFTLNQNGTTKNAHSDKFTLKKLLKNKLVKQLDQKNQSAQQQQEQERTRKQSQADGFNGDTNLTNNPRLTNNTFENLEHYSANLITDKGNSKKLTIKVFTFCLVDNYAVMTIESESFKSKFRKQQKKNEFHQTFHKEIMQRFEKNCKKIVVQLQSQLKSMKQKKNSLASKLKQSLQVGYEMLILNKNVSDFMMQQERSQKKHQAGKKNNKFYSSNKLGLNSQNKATFSSNNLFTFKKHVLDVCEFNPGKELFGWLSIFQSKLEEKKLLIFHEIDESLNNIINDKNKFNQIIFNLLDNAIKFTPLNGKIAVIIKKNLISSYVLDIHIINSLEKDLDTFALTRDLEQTLQESNQNSVQNNQNGDDDYYNVLKKIKLGIPVSRNLIQQIGPNNELNYKFKNNQIILHFQIFSDIRILKDNHLDESHANFSKTKQENAQNGEHNTSYKKNHSINSDRLQQIQKRNNFCAQKSSTANIKESKSSSNQFVISSSFTDFGVIGLGKQASLGQRFNHQNSLSSLNSQTQGPLIIKRLNSNNHQSNQSPQISGRTQLSSIKNKSRSLSNPFQSQNGFQSNIVNGFMYDFLPSINELMIDIKNSPDPQPLQTSKKLLQEINMIQQAQQQNQYPNQINFNKQNFASTERNDKLKNHISIIQESISENAVENSNHNFFFQNQANGFKGGNKLLQSQKNLLKETELEIIKSQQIAHSGNNQYNQSFQQISQQQLATSPSSLTDPVSNFQTIQKNIKLNSPEKHYVNGERINQSNVSLNFNANQSLLNASNSKLILSNKNNNKQINGNITGQQQDANKGNIFFKDINNQLEQSHLVNELQNSYQNSVEILSQIQSKVQNPYLLEAQAGINPQRHSIQSKNIQDYLEENSSARKDHLPYIPKISSQQEQDNQLSFEGWQNVDEQHNDSFQKWMEISTLRKYNELEFNTAFKPLQNNKILTNQQKYIIQNQAQNKQFKDDTTNKLNSISNINQQSINFKQ